MIQAQFIYVLESEGYGRLVLNGEGDNNLPMGFDEQRVSITRSPKFYGLFREFSTSLRFVTAGMDYVQNVYEKEGTEFIINIGVYEYQPLPVDKYYLYFAGLMDLSTYVFNETFVECDINESSLNRKIASRDDVKVNLGDIYTVEGEPMNALSSVDVQLHEREIKLLGIYELDQDNAIVTSSTSPQDSAVGLSLPMKLITSDVENLTIPSNSGMDQANTQFWNEAGIDSTFTVKGKIVGTMGVDPTFSIPSNSYISFRVYSDHTFTSWIDNVIWTHTGLLSSGIDVDIDVNLAFTTITKNQIIALIAYSDVILNSFTAEFTEIGLTIEVNQLFDTTKAEGVLMYEVGDKIINTISDRQAFYSDFFGRLDLNYDQDGAGALTSVHSGKQIRAIPNSYPSLTLSDWFKSVDSIWGLGMGIEYTNTNQPFIRVENKKHFFSGDVIATIHNVTEIKKEVAREWIYNEVTVGYEKAEYEEVNGLEEYNNKFDWSTRINTIKNNLDLVSKLRADGYGIEFARRLQFDENPTEDSKYDNQNFVIVVKKDGSDYQSVRAENYDIVENIFSPESAYNLDITPGRMLRNNGSYIRAGLEKYLDKTINFRFAEQKENLKSQKIGGSAIVENEDIDVNTLDSPLWVPEIYSFSSVLTREQLAAISKNPNGIIKFSTTTKENTLKYYYGWILDIDAEDREATWQLLRVNTSSPDVVIKDPEGSAPSVPPIIVDPSTTFGIFEGPFEFVFSG